MALSPEDIAALRKDGDLENFLRSLTGAPPPKPAPAPSAAPEEPDYHIPRKGAWPCGTAPSGPTPPPCGNCPPDIHHHHHEGDVA